jgi:hypothetical protein
MEEFFLLMKIFMLLKDKVGFFQEDGGGARLLECKFMIECKN